MRKLITMSFLLLITACGQVQNHSTTLNQPNGTIAMLEAPTDPRAYDPELLKDDPLFQIGDKGIESVLYNDHSSESSRGPSISHHQANDYTLHRATPNPAISPLNGSYRENVIEILRTP